MLRISKITDYGTLIMTHMAWQPERLYSAAELADSLGLGLPTVSKVLKALGRHQLVSSLRGAHGGYKLARPAREITVADIVDALEEQPFGLTECSASSGVCGLESGCRIRVNWMHINTVVRRALEDVKLADMIEPVPHVVLGAPAALPTVAASGHGDHAAALAANVHPVRGPDSRAKHPIS
ncbi:MAG: SUF system Fe-S cluster assembly regulator [Azoarcus sp.]|nr:SUF system Fe-S cluster assembly regulator [Azoarcus sp.]